MSPRPGSIRYGTISSEALPRAETPTWTSITRFYVENNGDVARASDDTREQAVNVLRRGLMTGRLGTETFVGRIDAAYQAKTHDELADIVTTRIAQTKGVAKTHTHVAFRAYSKHDLETLFAP